MPGWCRAAPRVAGSPVAGRKQLLVRMSAVMPRLFARHSSAQAVPRIRQSLLYVPGSSEKMLKKVRRPRRAPADRQSQSVSADTLVFDLEDRCVPQRRAALTAASPSTARAPRAPWCWTPYRYVRRPLTPLTKGHAQQRHGARCADQCAVGAAHTRG